MARYHTFPEMLGLVARDAMLKMLLTTHMVPSSVPWELLELISRNFSGPIVIGEDLMTI